MKDVSRLLLQIEPGDLSAAERLLQTSLFFWVESGRNRCGDEYFARAWLVKQLQWEE